MSNQGLRGIIPNLKNGVSRYSFIGYKVPTNGILRLSTIDVGKTITISSGISDTSIVLPKLNSSILDKNIILRNNSNFPLKVYVNSNVGAFLTSYSFLTIIPPNSIMLFVSTSIDTIIIGNASLYGTWSFNLIGTSPNNSSTVLSTSVITNGFTYAKIIMFDDYNGVLVGSSASGTIAKVLWLDSYGNLSTGTLTTLSGNSVGTFSADKLTSDTFVVATTPSAYNSVNVQAISINLNGALTFNTIGTVVTIITGSTYYVNHIMALNSSQAAVSYILNGTGEQYRCGIISITGTTCSLLTNNSGVGLNGTGSNASSFSRIIPLTNASFLWLFDNYNSGNVSTFGIVCTLSGSTLTYNGTPVNIGLTNGGFEAIADSSNQVLVSGWNNSGYSLFVLLSITGTTISTSVTKTLSNYAIRAPKGLIKISNNKALGLARNSSSGALKLYIVTFSDTNIDTYPNELSINGSLSDTVYGLTSSTSKYYVHNVSSNMPSISIIKLA